jgi:hypothetical protein
VERKKTLTAWDAHWAGKLRLPPGYRVELEADLIKLHRPDGSLAAAFSVRGAAPSEVVRSAEEDYRKIGKSSA